MVDYLVEAERSEILADVRPAHFTLLRIRLEMLFVRIRKSRHRSAVLQTGDGMTDHERLLQLRIECT